MTDPTVRDAVAQAVGEAYDHWALEHPSLAAVIDRIRVTERAAESLRRSRAFAEAVEAYHQSRGKLDLASRLLDLAEPVVLALLAM